MNEVERQTFIKNTEKMIFPETVGKLYQRAEMLGKLPLNVQKFIMARGAGDDPFIGFIVEPYCFFLAYEVTDLEAASEYLPPGYHLVPTTMFDDGAPRYCAILGAFNIHTSVFWGSRIELYLIAENQKTGMLSWIICDYESNTISYDPGQGFSGSTVSRAVITTSYAGEFILDLRSKESPNHIELTADLKAGAFVPLNQRLWVEGNLSVDYGGKLKDPGSEPFGLIFDPDEMAQALNIPLSAVDITHNTFGQQILASEPFEACCFPFAQHFLTTSFPVFADIKDETDLEKAVRDFNAAKA